MIQPKYIRAHLLRLMAAQGLNPIPQPLEYWRMHLSCVVGELSIQQTEEVLSSLEEVKLITSQLDPLTVRRYWITPAGVAASN